VDRVVEQEVEVLTRFGLVLAALAVVLPGARPAQAQETRNVVAACEGSAVTAALGTQACVSTQIGLAASPNPTPPGGTVSFSASASPATDCWDDLGHSWWGSTAFALPVHEAFTWTVYCAGDGIQSSSLHVTVDAGGGGGGGGGGTGGEVPAVTNLPAVLGTAEVGQTLNATTGSWTNSPTSYTYVWRGSGDLAELGRGRSLVLTQAHVGRQIRVDVLACNGTGCGSWAVSAWTAQVVEQLPVYDPVYAEGGDTDEFASTTLCSGRLCSVSLLHGHSSTGPQATSNAVCARVGGSVTRSNAIGRIWRMNHWLSFCADRSKVTRVWDRVVDGEILLSAVARTFYPWEWQTVTDSSPSVGTWSTRSFARIRFRMCGLFRFGPVCHSSEPWIELVLHGDGRVTCQSSVGQLRTCRVRL
jgi:hypothetical protein